MSKVILELDTQQIEELIEKLSISDKIKLVCRLEQETLRQRWDHILKGIDKRLQKFPVSREEISEEIKTYRQEKYAKGCN